MLSSVSNVTNQIKATVSFHKPTCDSDLDYTIVGDVNPVDAESALYYKRMNALNIFSSTDADGNKRKREVGYCAQVASLEMVTAVGLMISDARSLNILKSGGALLANTATTIAEFIQVLVAGNTKIEESTNKLMAGVVGLGGAIGFGKFVFDTGNYLMGNESEHTEITAAEKSVLTLGSLASAFFMFCNSVEKQLISVLGHGDVVGAGGKKEDRSSVGTDGRSDFRCFVEWTSMIPYMWFKSFKPFKFLVDGALPLMSLIDSFGELTKRDLLKNFLAPNMLSSRLYFGSEENPGGVREKLMAPILRNVYGLNTPKVHIKSNGNIEAAFNVKEGNICTSRVEQDIPSSHQAQRAAV